jgi:hypothetical protein
VNATTRHLPGDVPAEAPVTAPEESARQQIDQALSDAGRAVKDI